MPKRRRLLTPMKNKTKINKDEDKISSTEVSDVNDTEKEVSMARGRLKGALLEALDPTGEESDASDEYRVPRRDRFTRKQSSDDEYEKSPRKHAKQSYVLKLFDRSVDLSQFNEDSPLYPICRAWIANQPKEDYSKYGINKQLEAPQNTEESIELPKPEGPYVSRVPDLIPEQKERSKDNINLNYQEAPPPSREQLLQSHIQRWSNIRNAWLEQSAKVEARYASTQEVLNKNCVNII